MAFKLKIPAPNNTVTELCIELGEVAFVLGANGTGKSSLMFKLYTQASPNAHRIMAHRQTWLSSSANTLSPHERKTTGSSMASRDRQEDSRYLDHYSAQRTSVAIFDLIDSENIRAREISDAVRNNQIDDARTLAGKDAPLATINEILALSNIPIRVSISKEEIVASKAGGPPYGIAQLSDGERSALLIAADVLTADSGTLFLIDEPERHLHRSIASPLLSQLFARRQDCAFVVSTHAVDLALDNPDAQNLLVRSCSHRGQSVIAWDADIFPAGAKIDENIRKDILGGRRKLLFVEGDDESLDKPLYSAIFPGVSVISKASCRGVEQAVTGVRESEHLHQVTAFGIVDSDGRAADTLVDLQSKGIYLVPGYAVESLYYHPQIQTRLATRQASLTGEDVSNLLQRAKSRALDDAEPHLERLCRQVVAMAVREKLLGFTKRLGEIATSEKINVTVDVPTLMANELVIARSAYANGDLEKLISRYPIRSTPVLNRIAKELGFQDRNQYERAARKLLLDDEEATSFLRKLFGQLSLDILAT